MRQRDGKKMDITALADFSSNKQVELAWTTSLPIATGNDKGRTCRLCNAELM